MATLAKKELDIYFKGMYCTTVNTLKEFRDYSKSSFKNNECLRNDVNASYLLKDEDGKFLRLICFDNKKIKEFKF